MLDLPDNVPLGLEVVCVMEVNIKYFVEELNLLLLIILYQLLFNNNMKGLCFPESQIHRTCYISSHNQHCYQ